MTAAGQLRVGAVIGAVLGLGFALLALHRVGLLIDDENDGLPSIGEIIASRIAWPADLILTQDQTVEIRQNGEVVGSVLVHAGVTITALDLDPQGLLRCSWQGQDSASPWKPRTSSTASSRPR